MLQATLKNVAYDKTNVFEPRFHDEDQDKHIQSLHEHIQQLTNERYQIYFLN